MSSKYGGGISVIIPARNREETLPECLRSLLSSPVPADEIIVVDDASTDQTAHRAEELGVQVVRLPSVHDANYCRNLGAGRAHGNIFLFLDSDVVVQPSTLQRVRESFTDSETDAVVGLYTAQHRHRSVASQYKNLWIRYSYLRSDPALDWIFGAVAAIRKEVFWKTGGFDKAFFMKYGGEDLELGKRITQARDRIRLNPELEVEHLKHHTLASLLHNDYRRAQGFMVLAGKLGQLGKSLTRGFANVYPNFAFSVPLAWLMAASAVASLWIPAAAILLAACALLYVGLNAAFLSYYARYRGSAETVQAFGILILDHLVCGVGSIIGLAKWLFSR